MNNDLKIRLKRLTIYGIIGILYSAYLLYDYFVKDAGIWQLIMAICLLVCSIIFLVSPIFIKKKVNKQKK